MIETELDSAHCPLSIPMSVGAVAHDRLWMPFRGRRHPATDAMASEHTAWLEATGLLDRRTATVFRKARFHELAGLVYVEEETDVLRLAADFIAALFVLDDRMDTAADVACRDAGRAAEVVEVVSPAARSGSAPEDGGCVNAVARALADLTRRLEQRSARIDAYLAELDVYLDGVVEETRRRARGFASVDDYAEVRVAFSAVYACVELALAARGLALTAEERPLARLANLSVSWVNDVWSWPKERALDERSNLVAVLMDCEGLDERSAFEQACRRCDDVVAAYLAQRELVSDSVALRLLESWMRGNLDWHAHGTARYVEHLSVAPAIPSAARGRAPRERPPMRDAYGVHDGRTCVGAS
jgi:hypothetical protein